MHAPVESDGEEAPAAQEALKQLPVRPHGVHVDRARLGLRAGSGRRGSAHG